MKNVLFATTAIVAASFAGMAAADSHGGGISLSGDARLGLIFEDGAADDFRGTSRARVKFQASGTSDHGITFGMNFRAGDADSADDQSGSGDVSTKGEVFVDGSFGTLTYGDTDTGVEKRVGNVDMISLTGLGDLHENERGFLDDDASVIRYDYEFSNFGFSVSTRGELDEFAVGVNGSFDFGNNSISFGVGYDDTDDFDTGEVDGLGDAIFSDGGSTIAVSLGATFGSIDAKVAASDSEAIGTAIAASLGYSSGNLGLAGFFRTTDAEDYFGVGASYNLGGGLELKSGIVAGSDDSLIADIGFAMTF